VLGYDLGRQAFLADGVVQSGQHLRLRWIDRARAMAGEWKTAAGSAVKRFGVLFLLTVLSLGVLRWSGPRIYARLRVRSRVRRVRLGQGNAGDATLLYGRMLDLLKRHGYQKPPWFTPAEFVATLPQGWRAPVEQFTSTYNAVRFGADLQAAPKLSALLDRIEGMRT
jgi:hypothetical protein